MNEWISLLPELSFIYLNHKETTLHVHKIAKINMSGVSHGCTKSLMEKCLKIYEQKKMTGKLLTRELKIITLLFEIAISQQNIQLRSKRER